MQDKERMYPSITAAQSAFLKSSNDIVHEYYKVALEKGELFNIFRTLNRERDEVYGHSAFISELLNPDGSHGQGAVFLRLFLSQLGMTLPECEKLESNDRVNEKWRVFPEFSTIEGRIDILITGPNDVIVIENKIDALDQPQQMERYCRFVERFYGVGIRKHLLYLTLDGSTPSSDSLGELDRRLVSLASYENLVLPWLDCCIREKNLPICLKEIILQYQNLVKGLVGQSPDKNMAKKLAEHVIATPENLRTAKAINSTIKDATLMLKKRVWESLMSALAMQCKELQLGDPIDANEEHILMVGGGHKGLLRFWPFLSTTHEVSAALVIGIYNKIWYGFCLLKNGRMVQISDYEVGKSLLMVAQSSQNGFSADAESGKYVIYNANMSNAYFPDLNEECIELAETKDRDSRCSDMAREIAGRIIWIKEVCDNK